MQFLLKAFIGRCPLLAALALTGALALSINAPLAAAPGDADTTFLYQLSGERPAAVAVQPDGKILVGGRYFFNGSQWSSLIRLNTDGTLDTSFTPQVKDDYFQSRVHAIVVLEDGRIVVGGSFTTAGGVSRPSLARLHADGSLDTTFNPALAAYSAVYAMFPQPDGKLLVGGINFPFNSELRCLVRLLPDGSNDPSFDVSILFENYPGIVNALALQPDGKIAFSGYFTSVAGASRAHVARITANGSLDTTYAPSFDNQVAALAFQPNGQLLVGGFFQTTNGTNRQYAARLNNDGSLDPAFDPGAAYFTTSFALQADGRLLYSGYFSGIGRLDTNTSTPDLGSYPKPDSYTIGLALAANGSPILVGDFFNIGSASRNRVARLLNAPATESLTAPDATTVKWLRGGSAPESDFVSFALSNDSGTTWFPLGTGTRISGGWELTGLNLPFHFHLRARARTVSGYGNGSSGLVETIREITLPTPEINVSGGTPLVVISTGSTALATADATLFASTPVASGSVVQTFTVTNHGDAPLTVTSILSDNTPEFTVGTLTPSGPIAPDATATFTVTFDPALSGPRTATITLASNDPLTPSYTFRVGGEGLVFPNIELRGGTPAPGLPIPAGDTSPDSTDGTDFGTANVSAGPGSTRTFTLTNSGDGPLTVTAITSLAPAEFIVSGLTLPATLAAGDSTTFTVAFDPAATGPRTTDITIASDDADSPSYAFRVTGEGGTPDIAVTGLGNLIPDGDTSPDPADATEFGTVSLGTSSSAHTFTIFNEGNAPLVLTATPPVQLGGTNPGDFSLTQPGVTTLAPGDSTTFTVTFTPAATGTRTATLSIASDDPAANPYNFTLRGTSTTPGDLDTPFNPSANLGAALRAVAVQPDGKILVGGSFTTIAGASRTNLARLHADGTIDASFTPAADGTVNALVVLPDGKILVGGSFANLAGTPRSRLARLLPDGSLDPTYNPGVTGINVAVLVLQPDGNLLVGGNFSALAGASRTQLARLLPDGSLDPAFNPLIVGNVTTVALQPDGRIVFGGGVTSVGGTARTYLARLAADGSLDPAFNPVFNAFIESVSIRLDGDIAVGGNNFNLVNGVYRDRFALLNSDGSLDPALNAGTVLGGVYTHTLQTDGKLIYGGTFQGNRTRLGRLASDASVDPLFLSSADGGVYGVAIQADGRPVLVGEFSQIGSAFRSRIARLLNTPATQSLTAPDTATVRWLRGGTSPETGHVTFEISLDGGTVWTLLGDASRISGGWELTGLNLPGNFHIRARARTLGGVGNGSSGLVETIAEFTLPVPEITVSGGTPLLLIPTGSTALATADATLFDPTPVADATVVHTFTVTNHGDIPLDVTGITSSLPSEFAVGPLTPSSPVAPGDSATFTVTFDPATDGPRTATITVASNDPALPSYPFLVGGEGLIWPDIAVSGGTPDQPIPDGDTSPDSADDTDFGLVLVNTSPTHTFTLTNTGDAPLTIASIASSNPSRFNVSPPVLATLAPAAVTTFTVTFLAPATPGYHTANITVASNDPDTESAYTFAVEASAALANLTATGPGGGTIGIVNGATATTPANGTAFGSVLVCSTPFSASHTFTLTNLGAGTVNLNGTPLVAMSGAHPNDFLITQFPSQTALTGPAGTTTFTVMFNPSATGLRTATVSVPTTFGAYTFALSGTGLSPEMVVFGGSTLQLVPDGSTAPSTPQGTDFGTVALPGTPVSQTFTILNSGNAPLNFTNTPPVQIAGLHPSDFTVTAQPVTPVAPGDSATFTVTFDPTATGVRSALVRILNDDCSDDLYTFTLRGQADGPAIIVQDAASLTTIAAGDLVPTLTDRTDFGGAAIFNAVGPHYFDIVNLGNTPLSVSSITVAGPHPSDFLVVGLPSPLPANPTTILPGTTNRKFFSVFFLPTLPGTRTAHIEIASSDPAIPTYIYAVQGNGLGSPEINVTSPNPNVSIPHADSSPATSDGTDFGILSVGSSTVRAFSIRNVTTNTAQLHLTGTPRVALSGPDAADFTVTLQPALATIPVSGATPFQITFAPTPGTHIVRDALVTIPNDDADEAPYTFAIRGSTGAPGILVQGNSTTIASGDSSPDSADFTDLGVTLLTNTVSRPFVLQNTGSAPLVISAATATSPEFTVTFNSSLPVTVPAFSSVPFTVALNPVGPAGVRNASVQLTHNVTSVPYTFAVRGTSVPWAQWRPDMRVLGNSTLISDGDTTPIGTDHTHFGSTGVSGGLVTRTYTIENQGPLALNLTGSPRVSVVGGDFTVTQQPAATVAPGASTTFAVTFNPSAPGARTATVSIPNSDTAPAKNPYTFTVRGTGVKWWWTSGGFTLGNAAHAWVLVPDILSGGDRRMESVDEGGIAFDQPRAFSWGLNSLGQLGTGSTSAVLSPVLASPFATQPVLDFASGENHGVALSASGTVFAWGDNSLGQLGNGSTTSNLVPAPVSGLGGPTGPANIVHLAAGRSHSLALAEDGRIFAWGANTAGQLGNGSTTAALFPVLVNRTGPIASHPVVALAAGEHHSVALSSTGAVFTWGSNTRGQLGNGTTTPSSVPVAVDLGGRTAVSVIAGPSHTLILTADGQVFSWGRNDSGQLGDGTTTDRLAPVPLFTGGLLAGRSIAVLATGASHTLALSADGLLVAWGDNSRGQLGIDSTTSSLVPAGIKGTTAIVGILALAAGPDHSVILTTDGRLFACGDNAHGQLGLGTRTSSLVPVPVLAGEVTPGSRLDRVVSGPFASRTHLIARAPAPSASLGANDNPDLGRTPLGGSLTRTFTITNSGLAPLSLVDEVKFSGSGLHISDFTIGQPATTVIAPGGQLTFTVTFTPSGSGPRSAILSVTTNDPANPVLTFAINGDTTTAGTPDPAWINPGLNNGVLALALAPGGGSKETDSGVTFGGRFTTASPGGATPRRLARLDSTGVLDPSFHPDINGPVHALAVQFDGSVLVGGDFTSVGGQPRSRLARLLPDGSADPLFTPACDGPVLAFALQPDGGILVAGSYTTLDGVACLNLARLFPDGTLDRSFAPAPNRAVHAVALQADGKILIGGNFDSVSGTARSRLARLNADGSLDTTFAPAPNSDVTALLVQPDGRIVLGGQFTTVSAGASGPMDRLRLARLNANGSLDPDYAPAFDSAVYSLALQTNGKLLVAGSFTTLDTIACSRVARLNTNGTRDTTFAGPSPIDDTVRSVALQKDGCIVLGGDFISVGGTSRPFLTRLDNDPASDVLTAPSATSVLWLRSGASPAVSSVRFEQSTDGGLSWTYLGAGARNPAGGWALTGVPLSGDGLLRARGRTDGGGVPGLVESTTAFSYPGTPAAPAILVAPLSSQTVAEGGTATLSVIGSGFPAPAYQWLKLGGAAGAMPVSGATASTYTIPRVSPADSGTYRVLLTNASGTALSIPVTLSVTPVNDAPTIQLQPMGVSASRGDFVTLSVIATGKPAPAYQWLKDGVALPGAIGATLSFPYAQPADSATYTVVVSNSVASRTSAPAVLSVGTPPVITSAASTTFLTGVSGQFSVTAIGDPAPTIGVTGLPAWAAFDPATGALSGTPSAADAASSPYTLHFTATNPAGASEAQTFLLAVKTRFQVWREANFTPEALADPSLSGPNAAPFADGVSNLLRFAVSPARWAPAVAYTADGTRMTFRFQRPVVNPGVRYEVETSTNLNAWTTDGVDLIEVSNDGTTATWEASAPSAPARFFRLKVSVL